MIKTVLIAGGCFWGIEELFYLAEAVHQDYLQNNPGGYTCHYERSR